jgi:dihydroorotate dehydrogenase (fumarate)
MQTATSYLGFRLAHPFVASASPLGWNLDSIRQLEDGGCAAIVLPSLFEEQITLAAEGRIRHMDPVEEQWKAALAEYPPEEAFRRSPAQYAEHLAQVKRAVSVPVIGSLNGTTPESWLTYSRIIEQAGADGLELNLYEVVTNFDVSGAAIEHLIVQVVRELKEFIHIPVAVKLSPFFASPGNLAHQLDRAGADGLVLFNRFYQPDIDTAAIRVVPQVELSTSAELLLRLRWMAILHGRVRPSLGLTGGVAAPNDGIKAILAGADVVHLTSAILRHGPSYFGEMRRGLESWMEAHGFDHVDEVRGRLSLKQAVDPAAFERANYIRVLQSWKPAAENAGGTS